jgi:peptide-methionine (S)-S-oxide reductase
MTGHAESVRVTYDPGRISFRRLLDVYFTVAHDPTEVDRQGPDTGSQYRSEIFTTTAEQAREARAEIAHLTAVHAFRSPIATKIEALNGFYPAEAYHVRYMERHPQDPYILENDRPKLVALRHAFPDLVRSGSLAARL